MPNRPASFSPRPIASAAFVSLAVAAAAIFCAGRASAASSGVNVNGTLPKNYTYTPHDTPVFVVVPIVSLGVVADAFRPGIESGTVDLVVDAETPSLSLSWCWGDCDGSATTAAGLTFASSVDVIVINDNSYTVGDVSYDLPDVSTTLAPSGAVPSAPESFDIAVSCVGSHRFHFAVAVTIAVADSGTNTPLEVVTFYLRWGCYPNGCQYACLNGYCDALRGQCICDGDWVGSECNLKWSHPAFCPQDTIIFNYTIPNTLWDEPDAGTYAWYWFGLETEPYPREWRYVHTWDTTLPDETTDPLNLYKDVEGSGATETFMPPGEWDLVICSDFWADCMYQTKLIILDFDQCGYPFTCTEGGNDCNEDLGHGECVDGVCQCDDTHYWNDCSRGCDPETLLETGTGTFSSDNDVPDGQATRYLSSATCSWIVEPSGKFDQIEFNFDMIDLQSQDSVSYYVDDETDPRSIYLGVSGEVEGHTVDAKKLTFVLTASSLTSNRGFVISYDTVKLPLSTYAVALIATVCGLIGVLAAAGLVALGIMFLKRRKRRLLEALNTPAEFVDAEEYHDVSFNATESNSALEGAGIAISKVLLDFDLTGKDVFPVNEKRTDSIEIINNTGRGVHYTFYVPNHEHMLTVSLRPGVGYLPPKGKMLVTLDVTLLYTTHVELPIKFEVISGGETLVSTYLQLKLEGAISDRLDPNEIRLEPNPLAAGAFGAVFRGVYRSQLAAVKVIKHQAGLQEGEKQDFLDECDLLRKLHHPCIVAFIGASLVPGKMCVCTELVEHGSLSRFLESDVDIPYLLILRFATNIADAMAYLHASKILYRDLKCPNALLVSKNATSSVCCKLADFGTARNVQNPDELFRYTNGVGTPIYMAPELLRAEMYNSKADVYSYSLVLWEMWTREEAWSDTVCWDIPKNVQKGIRPKIPEDCPAEYSQLMIKCWDASAANRPAFAEIVNTLNDMFLGAGGKTDKTSLHVEDDAAEEGDASRATAKKAGDKKNLMSHKRATASGKISFAPPPDDPEDDKITAESAGFQSIEMERTGKTIVSDKGNKKKH
ncbi:serine/threonine-protein kinase STY13 [Pelomyxa schiedti]|nr:serine/threonine-protein kinase STY13 [Pelomyxa schiedti]